VPPDDDESGDVRADPEREDGEPELQGAQPAGDERGSDVFA
jgi:hypothetical protein